MKKNASLKAQELKKQKLEPQIHNINEEFTQSLNLPEDAQVKANMTKKSARLFETKIEISLWHETLFCRATGETAESSLTLARRKVIRLVSDLHDKKFVTRKHQQPKFEKRVLNDNGAI